MNDLFVRHDDITQFFASLTKLDRDLDAKHTAWRSAWICELRAAQAVKDAAVPDRILREQESGRR